MKKKKKGLTKIEKFLYKSSMAIILFLLVGIVFTSASVSKMNIELQEMNKTVESQEDTNESLAMKINEMASLENIQVISKNLGLAYNDENIKISFSAKYMMEALRSFSTETVDIHFVGEIKPILIKSSEDTSLTQLVLPIRTY